MRTKFTISALVLLMFVDLAYAQQDHDLSRLLMHSTVKIETTTPEGRRSGTGFYYDMPIPGQSSSVPLIVTCAHLLEKATNVEFLFAITGSNAHQRVETVRRISIRDCDSYWLHHPNPQIDLAAFPIAPLLVKLQKEGKSIDMAPLGPKLLADQQAFDDLSLFQEVKIVGYPIGLWDATNNFPIMRRGMLASDISKDFNGAPQFLIDAAILPGSSGSPVLVADQGTVLSRTGISFGSSRILVLGIVDATPVQLVPGKVEIIPIPSAFDAVAMTPLPSTLGVILKATLLKDFATAFKIPEQPPRDIKPTTTP